MEHGLIDTRILVDQQLSVETCLSMSCGTRSAVESDSLFEHYEAGSILPRMPWRVFGSGGGVLNHDSSTLISMGETIAVINLAHHYSDDFNSRVWTPPKMQAQSLLILNNVVGC